MAYFRPVNCPFPHAPHTHSPYVAVENGHEQTAALAIDNDDDDDDNVRSCNRAVTDYLRTRLDLPTRKAVVASLVDHPLLQIRRRRARRRRSDIRKTRSALSEPERTDYIQMPDDDLLEAFDEIGAISDRSYDQKQQSARPKIHPDGGDRHGSEDNFGSDFDVDIYGGETDNAIAGHTPQCHSINHSSDDPVRDASDTDTVSKVFTELYTLVGTAAETSETEPKAQPPSPSSGPSLINGLCRETSMKTCFRIADAMDAARQAWLETAHTLLIELFARVRDMRHRTAVVDPHSSGNNATVATLDVDLADMYHDRPPYLTASYRTSNDSMSDPNMTQSADFNRREPRDLFLSGLMDPQRDERLCRCVGRLQRRGHGEWHLLVFSIWEICWDDVYFTAAVVGTR